MSLTRTFDEIRWLDKNDTIELLSAALDEPYEEIQKQAVTTLLDERLRDRTGIIFKYFHKLYPTTREYILSKKWNVITAARIVFTTDDENTKLLAINVLAQVGGPDVANTLALCLTDTSILVQDKAVALLESIMEKFLHHLTTVRKSQDSKSYVDDNKGIIIEALSTIVNNFDRHKKSLFIRVILELGISAYNLITQIIIDLNTNAYNALQQEITNTNSEQTIELLFKLISDRDDRLSQFAKDIFNNKESKPFIYAISQYLSRLDNDSFNALSTRIKWDYLLPKLETIEHIDGASAQRFVSLLIKSNINEQEKINILSKLLKAKNYTIRIEAINGLKHIKYADLLTICYEALNDSNDKIKLAAAEVIIQINKNEKVKVLTPLLNAKDGEVRDKTVKYLSEESFERFILSFDRLSQSTREQAAKALAKLDNSMIEKLTAEINSLDAERRIKALKITELTGKEKELKQVLVELINDPDRKVRATAIKTLGLSGGFDALSIVVNLLKDPDSRIRANAIEAIEEIGDNRLMPIIEPFINDPDNRVKANAIKALWTMGKQDVAEEIKTMFLSSDDGMRLSAIWLISQLKCKDAYDILKNALITESDPTIRAKIEEAIAKL